MGNYGWMDEWLEEDDFAKIVAEAFSRSEEEVVEIKPMYDVKGNKIDLVHDLDYSDKRKVDEFKQRVKLGLRIPKIEDAHENIKVSPELIEYLLEVDKFQEFIDALPDVKSITFIVKKVEPTQDWAKFIEVERLLKEKNVEMYITNGAGITPPHDILYRLDEVLSAAKQLEDWVNEINTAKVDEKPLSPLEKFIYAYMIAKDRIYNKECDKFNRWLSRDVVAILNNDYCVCAGFALLLNELCAGVGIPCINKGVRVPGDHEINCVLIKDDKYDIDGLYYADPTKDSKKQGNTLFSCLLPNVEDVFDLWSREYGVCREVYFEEKELFPDEESLKRAQKNTKKIGYQNMFDALFAVFISKGKTKRDAAEYLKPSVHKVQAYPDRYKGNWVHDAAKANGLIQDYKR